MSVAEGYMKKSVTGRYWQPHYYDEDFVQQLKQNYDISDLLARILSSRLNSVHEAEDFLWPKIKNLLPDPFHLKDMDKAVKRLISAIEHKENIFVFADYDVDGASSAALIKNILRQINSEVEIYVPDRLKEGYGPTAEAMEKIKQAGASLLITVDCGSVAFAALQRAAELGLDVIIIDHHLTLEEMPPAVAIINPNRLDETSEYTNIAAVGVCFLFLAGLIKRLKELDYFAKTQLAVPKLLDQLDLVALGTVCDVMQLTGLNRAFVKQGLKIAKARKNPGYNALCAIANLQEELNCYHLGFILGPRINAGGRVGTSSLGANLLSNNCPQAAQKIAEQLEQHNQQRKLIELDILEEALKQAENQQNDPLIFVAGKDWHPGIIGIIASRVKEKYNKPAAIIAIDGQQARASCRSVRGIDFGRQIIKAKQAGLLICGGGHAMAAGFTVLSEKIKDLHQFLLAEFDKISTIAAKQEYYALELTTSAANLELITELNQLAPFGNGNSKPLICFSNLYVLRANIVGGKHLKITFAPQKNSSNSKILDAIAFNALDTSLYHIIFSNRPYNLSAIGTLEINNWQNISRPQLILQDLIIIENIC